MVPPCFKFQSLVNWALLLYIIEEWGIYAPGLFFCNNFSAFRPAGIVFLSFHGLVGADSYINFFLLFFASHILHVCYRRHLANASKSMRVTLDGMVIRLSYYRIQMRLRQ